MATGGGATSIGGLIIELRANSAQFHAEMEAARKGLKGTGDAAHGSGRQLSRFAAIAAEQVVPGLRGSRVVIENLFQAVTRTGGAFAAFGPALGVVGAALGGFALGNILANFRDLRHEGHGIAEALKLAIGSVDAFEERMKKAAEEEKKFNDELRAAGALRADFAKQLAQGRGDITARGRQFTGDDEGAARAELDTRLEIIELERKARERNILQQFTDETRRREFLKASEQIASQDRTKAYLDASVKIQKIEEERANKQIKTWQDETQRLVDVLKERVQARKAFEAQLGTGATALGLGGSSQADVEKARQEFLTRREMQERFLSTGQPKAFSGRFEGSAGLSPFQGVTADDIDAVRGLEFAWRDVRAQQEAYLKALQGRAGATQGFKEIKDLQESIVKATQDLAFNQREGNISPRDSAEELERIRDAAINSADAIKDKFGHIPAVIEAVDRAVSSVRFGNLGKEMAAARIEIDRTVASERSLSAEAAAINERFADMPAVTDQAAQGVKKLREEFNLLRQEVRGFSSDMGQASQQVNTFNNVSTGQSSSVQVILPVEEQTGVD